MKRADADVYYQNCAEYVTGQVALWCRHHARGFVYSVASDPDCDPKLPAMHTRRERVLYRYGLRHADRIIVQTRRQQDMLQAGFGLRSIVLPMPCPGPSDTEYASPQPPSPDNSHVLWVGRIAPVKRLEFLLEVAKALPSVTFHVAGMPYIGDPYSENVLREARAIANVTVHGMVPRHLMPELYQGSNMLCCTSEYEGFPNTFLEAWSYGLPIISTVDPDNLIAERSLGITAKTGKDMIAAIRQLCNSPARWQELSRNSRRYYAAHHAVDPVMQQFEQQFIEATGAHRR